MQRLSAEFLGTAILLATIVGSGLMGEALADGNIAIALLANTLATGAILVVLISIFAPISGAHFNPAVTLVFWIRGEIARLEASLYILCQIFGGIIGVFLAHLMFDLDVIEISTKTRASFGQSLSEMIATFGLIVTILLGLRSRQTNVALLVGLYISAAYWFTASTSFANPAVTIARMLSDSFAGIAPKSVPPFLLAQVLGAFGAYFCVSYLFTEAKPSPKE